MVDIQRGNCSLVYNSDKIAQPLLFFIFFFFNGMNTGKGDY